MTRRINRITEVTIVLSLLVFLGILCYQMGIAHGQETSIPLQHETLQDSKGAYWIVEEVLDWETGNGLIPQPASESEIFYIKVRRQTIDNP